MPSLPFIRSAHIENFRAIVDLRLEPLRRITLIGGLNGTGKTTVLDSVFQMLDSFGPMPALRAAQFRQTPTNLVAMHQINESADPAHPSRHTFATQRGKFIATWQWERQQINGAVGPAGSEVARPSESTGRNEGYTLSVKRDAQEIARRHFIDNAGGMMIQDDLIIIEALPNAYYLSRMSIFSPPDMVNRYSQVVQKGRKKDLIRYVQAIEPEITDFDILTVSNIATLHVTLRETVLPISFAGDGAATVTAIVSAALTSPGGVLCVDEFDASIHYSKQKIVWQIIHEVCRDQDVQIIAATHSRESAIALFKAVNIQHKDDVVFYRLDKVDGKNIATAYNWGEMQEVDAESWEIR